MEDIKAVLKKLAQDLFKVDVEPDLTRTEEQFGDYATNIALQLAKPLGKNPREIAEQIANQLKSPEISKAEVAGPGFINLTLTDEALWKLAKSEPSKSLRNKVVVAEYSDPNPFKVLHAGHLYTNVVGDSIANLLESAGAKVHRVNFGGDVGLHVAKTMWAIIQKLKGENFKKLADIHPDKRAEWLAEEYVTGSLAYGGDEKIDNEIKELNKRIYQLHDENDHDSPLAQIYWTTRQWSYDYFDQFYARIGTKFDKYYPESETASLGLKTVKEQLAKGVYKESNGAVIYDGEVHSLHTRVFINSEGLPTYETKDVGLIMKKWQDYHFDLSVIITGNDIVEYMKVVLASVKQFAPDLAKNTRHLTHGMVKLEAGAKMSSRQGNVLLAEQVLDAAAVANKEQSSKENDQVVLAAVKYAFLKQRLGGDIIYNPTESVAIEGNSGPYLQYAHARARSILAKIEHSPLTTHHSPLDEAERSLLRKISEYSEVIENAVQELLPSHVCTYLYELAQVFNRFYEKNRVIDDPRQNIRLQLVQKYADVLKNGLELLNIPAPESM